MVGDPRAPEPPAPEARRRGHALVGLLDAPRPGKPFGPGHATERALSLREDVAAADAIPLDPEHEIGQETAPLHPAAPISDVHALHSDRPLVGPPPAVPRCP